MESGEFEKRASRMKSHSSQLNHVTNLWLHDDDDDVRTSSDAKRLSGGVEKQYLKTHIPHFSLCPEPSIKTQISPIKNLSCGMDIETKKIEEKEMNFVPKRDYRATPILGVL